MTDTAEQRTQRVLARMPRVSSLLGVYVGPVGALVRVNVGESTITIPNVGQYPPYVGDSVQIELRDGQYVCTGTATPKPPMGKVTATGTPKLTVLCGGVSYTLGYRSGYSPAVGDDVEINWFTQIVQGKVTAAANPEAPPTAGGGGGTPFDLTFPAIDSGSYRGGWWTNDVYSSDNNVGAWFYGTAIADSIPDTAVIASCAIYLPVRQGSGDPGQFGLHNHAFKPGGDPGISSLSNLTPAYGWNPISTGYADFLKANYSGVGFLHGGYYIMAGVGSDQYSGALRITGTY